MIYNKKTVIVSFLITIFFYTHPDFITYQLNEGRLGDHLLTYTKAKLIQHLLAEEDYNLPLYCPDFPLSDQLMLSIHENYIPPQQGTPLLIKTYTKTFKTSLPSPIAYTCTLKTTIGAITGFQHLYAYTQQNPSFKNKLLSMIAPLQPIQKIMLPEQMISVAVHVRTGGGFDKIFSQSKKDAYTSKQCFYADKLYPTRFPPETYYIEQLAALAEMKNNQPLFVHIFTDDNNPGAIVERFKQHLKKFNIKFSYRDTKNTHDTNVLEDLFNMARFNCLIRPASSFSKMAQLLGNHDTIIYPAKATWLNNRVVVTQVKTIDIFSEPF